MDFSIVHPDNEEVHIALGMGISPGDRTEKDDLLNNIPHIMLQAGGNSPCYLFVVHMGVQDMVLFEFSRTTCSGGRKRVKKG